MSSKSSFKHNEDFGEQSSDVRSCRSLSGATSPAPGRMLMLCCLIEGFRRCCWKPRCLRCLALGETLAQRAFTLTINHHFQGWHLSTAQAPTFSGNYVVTANVTSSFHSLKLLCLNSRIRSMCGCLFEIASMWFQLANSQGM